MKTDDAHEWATTEDAAQRDGLDLRTLALSAPPAPECEDCGDPATRTSSDGVALCDGCYEAMEVYWRKIGEG